MDIKNFIPDLILLKNDVCDQNVSTVLLEEEAVSPDLSLPFGDYLFNAEASGSLCVKLFNDANDHEKEKEIFEHWPEAEKFYNNKALLSYGLKGKVKVAASGSFAEKFELGIDADQTFELKSFRMHDCGQKINDAFIDDVTSFRFLFSKESVLKLKPNEAVAFEASGKLEISASVKASDVITGTASIISNTLNVNGKINVEADASISLNYSISIEDDFDVIIIKTNENQYRVLINKIIKKTNKVSSTAGITAKIENEDEIDKITDQFFEGIEKKVFEPINKKLKENGIDENDMELVDQAIELLGWEDYTISEFKEKYEEKKKEVKEKIKKAAASKVEVGISYEYRRINTSESVFSALFTDEGIEKYHKFISTLRVGELIKAYLANNNAFKLNSFFKRETLEVDSSFGVNLAFGNFKITASIKNEFKQEKDYKITDKNEEKYKVSTYSRKTTKTFGFGVNADNFFINFDADMPMFVSNANDLTADKFDFEFGISIEMIEKKTNKREIENIIDWAITWDIIAPDHFDDALQKIKENVYSKDTKNLKYNLFLRIAENISPNNEILSDLFSEYIYVIPDTNNLTMASALAASLPYADFKNDPDFEIRKNIQQRRNAYTSFWLKYLDEYYKDQKSMKPERFSAKVGQLLYTYFSDMNKDRLAHFENDTTAQYPKIGRYSVEQILYANNLGTSVQQMKKGFDVLKKGIQNKQPYSKTLNQFYKKVRKIGFNEFNLRFLGRILLDLGEEIEIKEDINRGLTITFEEDGKEKVYVVA